MYKILCSICGKVVHRNYKISKPICEDCKKVKYYKYQKSGYYDSFKERNLEIYIARKTGASYKELMERFNLSRMRLFRIIEKIEREKTDGGSKNYIIKAVSEVKGEEGGVRRTSQEDE